jgi:hypothetical protein
LKKSFVELIFEENRQIFLSYDGILWQFESETRYFALRKTQQFLFPEKMIRSQRTQKENEPLDSRQSQEPTTSVGALVLN